MDYFLNYFQLFLVLWARVMGLVFIVTPFSSIMVPGRVKMMFALFFTMLIFPVISTYDEYMRVVDLDLIMYYMIIFKELMVGIVMGFLVAMFIAAFQLSASYFSIQMGLGFSSIMDPSTGEEGSLMGYVFYNFVLLIFFSMGGMHLLLNALVDSYHRVSILHYTYDHGEMLQLMVQYFSNMFYIALKIAMPIIFTSTLLVIIIGFLGKVAPQANLLILGLPIQWMVGFLSVVWTFPYVVALFNHMFEGVLSDSIGYLEKIIQGRGI